MPKYKLVYYNARGRAETSRLLFALAGVEYTDARFEPKDWPAIKEGTPFGQVPILEVDGKVLSQSHAIERYLARQFGLAGKTTMEQARVDMIVDCVEDYIRLIMPVASEPDPDKKKEGVINLKEQVAQMLNKFQKILKQNPAWWSGHFVGSEFTLADVAFYYATGSTEPYIGEDVPESWDKWPGLKSIRDAVGNHPRIQHWNSKRPKTNS